MSHGEEIRIDVRERGANQQTSDRRLFMSLLAFGDCPDPKGLVRTLDWTKLIRDEDWKAARLCAVI